AESQPRRRSRGRPPSAYVRDPRVGRHRHHRRPPLSARDARLERSDVPADLPAGPRPPALAPLRLAEAVFLDGTFRPVIEENGQLRADVLRSGGSWIMVWSAAGMLS